MLPSLKLVSDGKEYKLNDTLENNYEIKKIDSDYFEEE